MKSSHGDWEDAGHDGLSEAFEAADPLEGGLTNDVRRTDYDTVIKEFAQDPPLAHVLRAYNIGQSAAQDIADTPIDDALDYLDDLDLEQAARDAYEVAVDNHDPITRQSRMEAEHAAEDVLDMLGIETPEIRASEDGLMEYEAVDGQDLPRYLQASGAEETYEAARRFGEDLRAMHDAGMARRDNRPENTLVEDDGTLVHIDHEYATVDAGDGDYTADLITFVSGIRQLDPDTYETARAGFEDGYGDKVGMLENLTSPGTSLGHAAIEEGKDLRDAYRTARQDAGPLDAARETVETAQEKSYDRIRNAISNTL